MIIFLTTILPALVLLVFSALFSGLTLGLMSLDPYVLERKAKLGNQDAIKIYPIRKKGNELLTALLLGNVAVNSALSIFLTSVTTGLIAGAVATGLIFTFGEVIPQASIPRHALKFGAKMTPFVKILLLVTYPITKPFGVILDKVLGREIPTLYSKQELVEIFTEHEDAGGVIDADEERILKGALRFSDRKAVDVMTPRTVVFTISADKAVDKEMIEKIKSEGYSRVPVWKESVDNVVGILRAKDLLGVRSGNIGDFIKPVVFVEESLNLDDLKNNMLQSHQHMVVVKDELGVFSGVVTLEDILEEVIGREIMDEEDTDPDMQEVARKLPLNM